MRLVATFSKAFGRNSVNAACVKSVGKRLDDANERPRTGISQRAVEQEGRNMPGGLHAGVVGRGAGIRAMHARVVFRFCKFGEQDIRP